MDSISGLDILIVDDDPDDCLLLQEALEENMVFSKVIFKHDGEELLDYLQHCYRLPGLILLDLNMPRKDGREALAEIKGNTRLHTIPVIVLTTSDSTEDAQQSYERGANAFISKPTSFSGLVSMVHSIRSFWLETAVLPLEDKPL
ncbi:chemotaxis protein CheY [Pseudomonas fluorescens HK44]|uniref:Chemotaxis protein CheY n=1 Tax=Pseudomonas fluorescens HK44 TaxID=1042209 RepID=A0A010ST35_PSEFL|nr:response regulator [Pseudomonas fluorescens]EXF95930.1 chemotaxis protein CheY [Pseudomonas fluorescens HK44]